MVFQHLRLNSIIAVHAVPEEKWLNIWHIYVPTTSSWQLISKSWTFQEVRCEKAVPLVSDAKNKGNSATGMIAKRVYVQFKAVPVRNLGYSSKQYDILYYQWIWRRNASGGSCQPESLCNFSPATSVSERIFPAYKTVLSEKWQKSEAKNLEIIFAICNAANYGNDPYLLTYSMEQSPSWEANWFCS